MGASAKPLLLPWLSTGMCVCLSRVPLLLLPRNTEALSICSFNSSKEALKAHDVVTYSFADTGIGAAREAGV